MLSTEEVDQYHNDGFVIPDFRIDEDTLEHIRSLHKQLITDFPHFSDYCPAVLPLNKGFLQVARNEAILDMVSQVIGTDIALWNSSFFAKPARIGSKTPWHQDGEYWPIRPLATCTVWIAVDRATTENGCLRVVRGSHKDQQLRKHEFNGAPGLALNQELQATEFDASKAVNMEMEAGQISLHDVYLVHGSEANRSEYSRRGMTLRFMPTTSHYDREIEKDKMKIRSNSVAGGVHKSQRLPLYLMRGIDRCQRNDYANSFSKSH